MNTDNTVKQHASLFDLDGVPKMSQAIPLALQHVVAMIVGCVTPAIIISGAAGIDTADRVLLIQASLVVSALATLLQLFPIGNKNSFHLGAGLPVILGVSFAYVPSMQAIAEQSGIPAILGAQIVGGVCAILVGLTIKKIRKFFPPLIAGTVVFTIGLSLYPTAINYMAGGAGQPTYGAWQNWVVGISFEASACVALGLLFVINSVQAIGDFSATTAGGLDREPTTNELHGAILGYGFSNIIGAFLGCLPTATYSQNVGIVATTKVVNRVTLGLSALIILVAGLFPKFSALLTTIPYAVLGGATVSVFASIAMTGMKLVMTEDMNYRNTSIVGLAAALGMGVSQASASLSAFPTWVTTIFGKSPVVIATLVAILLNVTLPKDTGKVKKN